MSRRVRIPSVGELQTIKDHGLHQALVGDLIDDVRNALEALDRGLQEDEISLETIVETLAGLLPAQPRIRKIVEEVAELGGSTITAERDVYLALAKWIVDNQIGRGFDWEASTPPERRG
jgi:hypothetical protein